MPLEILNRSFMLFGQRARGESTKVAALAGLGIKFARVNPILA